MSKKLSSDKSTENDSVWISPSKKAEDWKRESKTLVIGQDKSKWEKVAQEYYYERLKSRYLRPIHHIMKHGCNIGEGFAIVAIQCSLVEFLESTVQGKNYKYLKKGEKLEPFEYSSSKCIFVSFLTKQQPFSAEFKKDVARDFYAGVRCGILHEAATKNSWLVHAEDKNNRIISSAEKIVFRDNFQKALEQFIESFCNDLPQNPDYQRAFIRKFNYLCK